MSTPGIGIIGPGAIADLHARALVAAGIPLLAAAGPDAADLESLVTRFGIPACYRDSAEMLADDRVDAVIIAAPSPVHVELTRAALEAGKSVLCEVPLALDVAGGREVVALAEARGLTLGVAHTLRYWEPHRLLAEALAAAGGPAVHVVVRSMLLRQTDAGWTGKPRGWTDSAIWHHGAHAVDAALWFLGDVPVTATCVRAEPWNNGSVMDATFAVRSADGRIASVDLSYHARRAKADFLVLTESSTWEIVGGTLFRDGDEVFAAEVGDVQSAAIQAQDEAFVRAIAGDRAGFYSADQALPALEVLATST